MEPAQQSYAPSASERPYSEGPANAPAVGNGHGQTTSIVAPSGIGEAHSRDSGSHYFLLATLVLALIGWLISLVSQAVVAAQISNGPVRTLWFGIIIQTIVTALVVEVIISSPTYNPAYAYGTQISILAALATVFAVLGVDQNVYSPRSAQKATGAGWLILAIVDLLWIFYFIPPPQSSIARLVSTIPIGSRRADDPYRKVEKIGRSTDAFPMSSVHQQQQPRSGNWSVQEPAAGSGARATVTSAPSENRSTVAGGSPRVEGSEGRPDSGTALAESPAPSPLQAPPEELAQWRAEALFDYNGSETDPTELVFKKGQVLAIINKEGKWWQARTKEGQRGIVPSNYVRLL